MRSYFDTAPSTQSAAQPSTRLSFVCVFEHHERFLKASAAGLSYASEQHYFGAYCISPLPNDQSSRFVSSRLIQISSFRT